MDRRTLLVIVVLAAAAAVMLFFRITGEADALNAGQQESPAAAPSTEAPPAEAPAKPPAAPPAEQPAAPAQALPAATEPAAPGGDAPPPAKAPMQPAPTPPAPQPPAATPPRGPAMAANPDAPPPEAPEERITLGSLDPASRFRMLVTFTSRGAAIERVELNSPDYLDIADKPEENHGYLGHLDLVGGGRGKSPVVGVVGAGTPAARAVPAPPQPQPGLMAGDELLSAQRLPGGEVTPIDSWQTFQKFLRTTVAGDRVEIKARRVVNGAAVELTFPIDLVPRPMQVIRPGTYDWVDPLGTPTPPLKPYSYLFGLHRVGAKAAHQIAPELTGIGSFRNGTWRITRRPTDADPTVEFARQLSPRDWRLLGQTGDLEVVKRFTLARASDETAADPHAMAYHLTYELEIRNRHTEPIQVAYHQSGPTGLPEEGWWYSYKVHPTYFNSAGTRDVIWRSKDKSFTAFLCSDIAHKWRTNVDEAAFTPLAGATDQMQYVGVDAIYFSSVLLNGDLAAETPFDPQQNYTFARTDAAVAGKTYAAKLTRSDVTFELTSSTRTIEAGGAVKQRFLIFAGPKQPELLRHYDLEDSVVYGWFAWFAKILLGVLHFFYALVGNYGLSIILLTALVRLLMFPLSRQMAINQQAMQDLAPELAKINEKYKDDMTKRAEATQELYNKNGVNPLSGCLFMPLQMPIFIGLYRGLAVDVALRQAALIPGLAWCNDLAGPDKFWYWQPYLMPLGLGWLVGDDGYLGPYLNILPLITMVFFLWQSRQFQTPAADEQQEMMQNVSTFMMVFMSFLFFKVAAGLCLYFIASSVWGIVEKQFIPAKPKPAEGGSAAETLADDAILAANAAEIEARKARKRKRAKELE